MRLSEIQLRPCPTRGCGIAKIRVLSAAFGPFDDVYIQCVRCGMSTYIYERDSEAVGAWNARNVRKEKKEGKA